MFFVAIIVAIFLCFIAARIYKNISNPVVIISFVYAVIITLHAFAYNSSIERNMMYLFITLGLLMFSIPFIFINRTVYKTGKENNKLEERDWNYKYVNKLLIYLVFLEICRFGLIAYNVIKLAGGFTIFMTQNQYVRYLYLNRTERLGYILISYVLSLLTLLGIILLASVVAKRGIKKYWFLLVILIISEAGIAYFTMSKMSFIISLCIFIGSLLNTKGQSKRQFQLIRKIAPVLLVIVFALVGVNLVQRGIDYERSLMSAIFNRTDTYFMKTIEAFSILINNKRSFANLNFGTVMLRPLFSVFSRLGLIESSYMNIHLEGVVVDGKDYNAFSIFGMMYYDFGLLGIIIYSVFVGFLFALLYRASRSIMNSKRPLFVLCLDTMIVTTAVMSFYTFLFAQTIYLIFMIFIYFIEKIFRNKLYIEIGED